MNRNQLLKEMQIINSKYSLIKIDPSDKDYVDLLEIVVFEKIALLNWGTNNLGSTAMITSILSVVLAIFSVFGEEVFKKEINQFIFFLLTLLMFLVVSRLIFKAFNFFTKNKRVNSDLNKLLKVIEIYKVK